MGQLRSLQLELNKILSVGSETTESPFWKEGLPARLQVYRNTVHGNAYDTLDSDFSYTKKQFSEDEWFDLSEAFFKSFPPSFWELNGCVTSFPKFLKKKKVKLFISELAEFEWADLETFVHPGVARKEGGRTNPTFQTRVFQHNILDWYKREADPTTIPDNKPQVLIFYRNTKHEVRIRQADPLMLLLLDHFSKPGAQIDDAEPLRKKLLPTNKIDLKIVLDDLVKNDLILL